MIPDFPDPVLRQPLTLTAIFPLYLSHYAMAVLVILPNTFILKLSLLPFIIWKTWTCTMGLSVSMGLARSLGLQSGGRLAVWDSSFVVRSPSILTSSGGHLLTSGIAFNAVHGTQVVRADVHQETVKEV
jgi:hypothetical protein